MSRFLPVHGSYPVSGWRPPAAATGDLVVLMTADPNDGDDIPALPWDTGGWFLVWSDLGRETSGEVQVPAGDYLVSLDPESGAALVCRAVRDPATLTCDRSAPGADEANHLFSVPGITSIKFLELDLAAGRVYIFGKDNVLYVANIGEALQEIP
jgi:hypothetical protein